MNRVGLFIFKMILKIRLEKKNVSSVHNREIHTEDSNEYTHIFEPSFSTAVKEVILVLRYNRMTHDVSLLSYEDKTTYNTLCQLTLNL